MAPGSIEKTAANSSIWTKHLTRTADGRTFQRFFYVDPMDR